MKPGDIVRHKFSRNRYVVERLTTKKAEVRQILRDNKLSDSTIMVLQQSLEPVNKVKQS
jgi:hypothetical protein